MWIPTKPPPRSEMIAPAYSEMMSPLGVGGLPALILVVSFVAAVKRSVQFSAAACCRLRGSRSGRCGQGDRGWRRRRSGPDHLVPGSYGQLAGDSGGTVIVALFEYLEQIMTGERIERFEAPIVENEELDAAEGALEPGVATIPAGERQAGNSLGTRWYRTERSSRQALCPSAQASQLFPTPVGPVITRLSCFAIQSPATSFMNSARSNPRSLR